MAVSSLNVVALISGGKDSLFSLLHCQSNGHKVVALANLYPASSSSPDGADEVPEDTDSYMYQTIGHSVIPLYQEALGIPLYRRAITGSAVNTARDYGYQASSNTESSQDETEDLIPLLQEVMRNHPEANAVSTGAILSTYQRTRVESVALRLGLTPLGYLWQYPFLPGPDLGDDDATEARGMSQTGLLDDMAAAGCEARIIKVASAGLGDQDLWKNVSETHGVFKSRLIRNMARFVDGDDPVGGGGGLKGAVLGEGGEYETLALDGPSTLWKKRIVIEDDMRETVDGEGGVSFMRIKAARCDAKDSDAEPPSVVRRPSLWDSPFDLMVNEVREVDVATSEGLDESLAQPAICRGGPYAESQGPNTRYISNILSPDLNDTTPSDQMQAIVDSVRHTLAQSQLTPDDIIYSTILLRSMDDFTTINPIYATLFSKPNPPARATVACGDGLPAKAAVTVSIVVNTDHSQQRRGLHVQSRSYWAPANIGPYSQAIKQPIAPGTSSDLVYIAGQIPLEPASMNIIQESARSSQSFPLEAVLALQHLCRISHVLSTDWFVSGIAYLAQDDLRHTARKAAQAWRSWEMLHSPVANESTSTEDDDVDGDDGPDAWDLKYGNWSHGNLPDSANDPSHQGQQIDRFIPAFDRIIPGDQLPIPPFLAVEVSSLPRAAQIEWQGLGLCLKNGATVSLSTKQHDDVCTTYHVTIGDVKSTSFSITTLSFDAAQEKKMATLLTNSVESSLPGMQPMSSVTAYFTAASGVPKDLERAMIVPCASIWGPKAQRLAAAIVIRRG